MSRPNAGINPTTGTYETEFRERVRDILGLPWDARDEQLFAELRRRMTQSKPAAASIDDATLGFVRRLRGQNP
jgi:hypothetical protein